MGPGQSRRTLEALGRFCVKHSNPGITGTLTIDQIMKIARLIFDTNYFAYNDKYYKQIRGGAMGSAFTQVSSKRTRDVLRSFQPN